MTDLGVQDPRERNAKGDGAFTVAGAKHAGFGTTQSVRYQAIGSYLVQHIVGAAYLPSSISTDQTYCGEHLIL